MDTRNHRDFEKDAIFIDTCPEQEIYFNQIYIFKTIKTAYLNIA